MKAAFHYIFKAKLIRPSGGLNEFDFIEKELIFENENPIIARDEAFRFYESFVEVLLQGLDRHYNSDSQAREDLKGFIYKQPELSESFNKHYNFSTSWQNGIGIYLVIDTPFDNDNEGDTLSIHGIGNIGVIDDSDSLIFDLQREFDYYKKYEYDCQNQEAEVVYCNRDEWESGHRINEPSTYTILKTPFNWGGFDVPYWWGDSDEEEIIEENEHNDDTDINFEEIISKGESNQVEFKPALLYNFKTMTGGIGVKNIIAKAICAFLNSNGGLLFIGVSDQKEVKGIDSDFKLANGKQPKDFFLLEFDQMIQHFLSFSVKSRLTTIFEEVSGKTIFIVKVMPSQRPVFLTAQTGKEFYVRGEASTRQIVDVEELINYCLDKWGANNS